MAKANRITFFACDNGDASLIEAHGWTIMTDINYRAAAADEDDETALDFAPKVREACSDDALDVFVLTHPDEDHLAGFGEVFHLGAPGHRDDDPEEGDVKIIVNDIWCSTYSADPNYTTDVSKPVLEEIGRRLDLQGTEAGQLDGNRVKVLEADGTDASTFADGIVWRLLAPNNAEADIPVAPEGTPRNSSNPSSLVIRWSITVGDRVSNILLAGDAPVEIWERLNEECEDSALEWHILLASHHCSRLSMGRKEVQEDKERFTWSEEALAALDHPLGERAHVVASSRKFGADHPPHPQARRKYWSILAGGGEVDDEVEQRFVCTSGEGNDDPKDIVFNFTSRGPTLAALAAPAVLSAPSSTGGGGYGRT